LFFAFVGVERQTEKHTYFNTETVLLVVGTRTKIAMHACSKTRDEQNNIRDRKRKRDDDVRVRTLLSWRSQARPCKKREEKKGGSEQRSEVE
jgi:hypothetical protein